MNTRRPHLLWLAPLVAALAASEVTAALPEPDVIFYGTATAGGAPAITGDVVSLRVGNEILASYPVGTDGQIGGGEYVLRVPLVALVGAESRPTGRGVVGLSAAVFVARGNHSLKGADVSLSSRGVIVPLNVVVADLGATTTSTTVTSTTATTFQGSTSTTFVASTSTTLDAGSTTTTTAVSSTSTTNASTTTTFVPTTTTTLPLCAGGQPYEQARCEADLVRQALETWGKPGSKLRKLINHAVKAQLRIGEAEEALSEGNGRRTRALLTKSLRHLKKISKVMGSKRGAAVVTDSGQRIALVQQTETVRDTLDRLKTQVTPQKGGALPPGSSIGGSD